jgi:WD40 repeat protein
LFDYAKKKEVKKWRGHEKDITKVLYCQKLNSYLSASRDKTIKLWSVDQPTCRLDMNNGHTLVVTSLAVNIDNTFVISGSRDNNLNLWDLQTAKLLLTSHISRNLVRDYDSRFFFVLLMTLFSVR